MKALFHLPLAVITGQIDFFMSEVRVRFAPSPTGFFHIGGARTALFNWLYARHTGGEFILRIEDTDRERNTDEALKVILEGMRWLGMDWDEGPEAGGPCGPYFQSQRSAIYQEHLDRLKAADRVYEKDGAMYFRLEGERYTAYDNYRKCDVEKVKAAPQVIDDQIRGRVERAEEQDFVLFRRNGEPVFHFVNVVDDLTMGITHVIRGEDHLSNTSKHCELFKAFGVKPPVFAHIPLILKSNGPGKMSKRDEGSLVEEYQRRRFVPEAVRNYLCLLGWSPKDDREKMEIDEIIRLFDLPAINSNNARFDEKKLSFLNAAYLRDMPAERFVKAAWDSLVGERALTEKGIDVDAWGDEERRYFEEVMNLCQEKVRSIEDLPDFVAYFFTEDYRIDEKASTKVLKKGEPKARLTEMRRALEGLDSFDEEPLEATVTALSGRSGASTGEYIHPTRLALSGINVGPSFYGLMRVLGRERVLSRLDRFLERL